MGGSIRPKRIENVDCNQNVVRFGNTVSRLLSTIESETFVVAWHPPDFTYALRVSEHENVSLLLAFMQNLLVDTVIVATVRMQICTRQNASKLSISAIFGVTCITALLVQLERKTKRETMCWLSPELAYD